MKKYKKLLGVEIGVKTLKMAEVKNGKLTKFACVHLPDNIVIDNELVDFSALADFIKITFKENKFSTKTVALILPDASVITRHLTMPAMAEKQLITNLPYEFNGLLTDTKDKYVYDFSVIGTVTNDYGEITDVEMLGAVVKGELLERYAEMFKKAGLKMVKAGPCETAMSALIFALREAGDSDDVAILDIGYHATKIQFFEQGRFEMDRTIDTGVDALAQIVSEQFNIEPFVASTYLESNKNNILESEECVQVYSSVAIELMRVINFYAYEHQSSSLDTVYYCGGGGMIERFIREISDTIDGTGITLRPLSDLGNYKNLAVMRGPTAIGTCVE